MKVLSAITDPIYVPRSDYNAYERFWLRWLRDERDLPFIHLLTRIHLIVIPFGILLFTPILQGGWWWLAYVVYAYVAQSYFKGRFGLMYHCICHRPIFKKPYAWIQRYITWCISPIFGQTPETYFSHHIAMHHVENNMEEDKSSTLSYQRDNIWSFIHYLLRFIFTSVVETIQYFVLRKRKNLYLRMGIGEILYILFCVGMSFVNLQATIMVLVVPVIYARIIMSMGNWTQHAFIDARNPDGHFSSVYNCINTSYNRNCWNDGYHSIHHFNPGLHYTEIPGVFLAQKESFKKHKTFIFDGIHYLHIFFWLMTKQYGRLADHLVNIDNTFASREEAIQLLKERVKPVRPESSGLQGNLTPSALSA